MVGEGPELCPPRGPSLYPPWGPSFSSTKETGWSASQPEISAALHQQVTFLISVKKTRYLPKNLKKYFLLKILDVYDITVGYRGMD